MKKLLLFLLFIGAATSCFARRVKPSEVTEAKVDSTITIKNETELNRGWKFMIESEGKPLFKGFKYLKTNGSSKSVTIKVPTQGNPSFTIQILSIKKFKKLGDNKLSASDRVSFVIKVKKPVGNMEFLMKQERPYGSNPTYNDVIKNTDIEGGDDSCTITRVK